MRLILSALLALITSPAFAYDDPAVAVCEFVAKHLSAPSIGTYTRRDVMMQGRDVVVKFEIKIEGFSPKQQAIGCHFYQRNPDGWHLYQIVGVYGDLGIATDLDRPLSPLYRAGVYPISPADTKLHFE